MVRIVNWLLTRVCNLKCEYCRIVKNYSTMPEEYPPVWYYRRNQMSPDYIISGLKKLKKHNPDMFHIFYGGEPLLYPGLHDIINFCNENQIYYTIISNNTEKIQPLIKKLFKSVEYIEGFTASVDPIIFSKDASGDIIKKSLAGFDRLKKLKGIVKDLVAEITVTNDTLQYLYPLVKELTNSGINSDITFVDISKSKYYDFSDVENDEILVRKSPELRDIINRIIDEKLNVHMRDFLLPSTYDILPSELDCGLENDIHNLCVDSDGSIRLCLRIRGVETPYNFNLQNCIDNNGTIHEYLKQFIGEDKRKYCLKCNHTCYIMSKVNNYQDLVHEEIRNEGKK